MAACNGRYIRRVEGAHVTATREPLIVVAAAITLLFAAAGDASTGRTGGTLRIVEGGLASTIDHALIQYGPEVQILDAACGGLVAFEKYV